MPYKHLALGASPFARLRQLHYLVRSGQVAIGGNAPAKIYGTLHCKSGKRLKPENRVFFANENEAVQRGFRPCGNCMKEAYLQWKVGLQHTQLSDRQI